MIHETLESGGRIAHAKGHYQELILTLMSSKCIFGNVFLFHTDPVVAKTKIKFGEVLRTKAILVTLALITIVLWITKTMTSKVSLIS
jgi:hypothetical protein